MANSTALAVAKPAVTPQRDPAAGKKSGVAAPVIAPVVNGPLGSLFNAGPALTLAPAIQCKVVVGPPNDPFEQEADRVADRVTADGPPTRSMGIPAVSSRTAATIDSPGAGQPIAPALRSRIEPHVAADLGGVRVHTGLGAQHAAASLQARAFTHRQHIFLGRGESPTNLRLMAHEATHVVQQGAAVQRLPLVSRAPDQVQRLPAFISDRLASYARHIPGYTLFTVIIGFNPLTGSRVERNAMNLVEGVMGLVPFGTAIFDKLRELGILQQAFEWIEGELARFDLSLGRLERLIEEAYEEMDFLRLDPFDYNLAVLTRKFSSLLDDLRAFANSLVDAIIELIKDAVLGVAEGLLAENRAWALLKKVLHYDPLRGEPVEATTEEILADFLLLIGKETELAQMQERGTLAETAAWLDTQFAVFIGLLAELGSLFSAAWDAIQPENLPDLTSNLQILATRVLGFVQQVWDFASTVALKVLELIKKSLLGWLSSFADEVPGFHLITVILGRNPFTEEAVPRTAENIIRGFITLLPGGNATYQHLVETGTIAQAAAAIEGAMAELGISWELITGIFTGIWDSLTIDDLLDPIGAFTRIVEQFGEPIGRVFAFIRVVLRELFTLILQLMNFPSDLIGSIISNAMQAFESIKNDPVAFIKNMLLAVKQGFSQFFDNILQHLLGGLVDWLFRGLREAGIEPPTDLSLASILDFVLQVLGISLERIWEKLAEHIGQEAVDRIRGAIDRLVGVWSFVRDVQERGVAAIWEYIEGQISGLWDMVLEQARNWIMERIVNRAIQWLLSLLDPTGIMPVINSFMAFFNAVQSAIEYLRDILVIINDYVSTVAAIARGELQPGADRLEQGLANAIPVAIGFLANQFGLGRIGDKIAEIVGGIRGLVDRALDWLIGRAVSAVQSVLALLGIGGASEEPAADVEPLEPDEVKRQVREEIAPRMATPFRNQSEAQQYLDEVLTRYRPLGLQALALEPQDEAGTRYDVVATASPEEDVGDLVVSTDVVPPVEGEIRYAADGDGRPTRAWGWLSSDKGGRDPSAQTRVSQSLNALMERLSLAQRFDAGHLIADRYGGAGDERNLVPQEMRSNRSWWKTFEGVVARAVASNAAGDLVFADVRVTYPGDPYSGVVEEDELTGLSDTDRADLRAALHHVPAAMRFAELGRRKADGSEEPLPKPGSFDMRATLPSLGRSLRGIVGESVSRGRDLFE